MQELFEKISAVVWGMPLIILLVGTGIYLTVRLRFIQVRRLGYALYLAFIKRREYGGEGDISHFQALMTALSATVGIGNIAGVAAAIAAGGPGALLWMWITGFFGMASKYSEAFLGVKYRQKDENGKQCGGPMYYIEKGLGIKWLGALFALFTTAAAFGIGNMVQANTVACSMSDTWGIPALYTGIFITLCTALVIIGGIKSIGRAAGALVPFMVILYISAAGVILALSADKIIPAVILIIKSSIRPEAAAGGAGGAILSRTIRMGVARGLFSNESGLGSGGIVAAAAQTKSPQSQALVSMTQTFIDTIVVCMLTGLVIVVTGAWQTGKTASELSLEAFNRGLPGGIGGIIVTAGIILFAYSTLIGWSYYGEKASEYLFGERAVVPYRVLFCIFVFIGAVVKLEMVWTAADITNGLMAFPNLCALLLLSGTVAGGTLKGKLSRI